MNNTKTLPIQSRTHYPLTQEQRVRIVQELNNYGVLNQVIKLVSNMRSDIDRWDAIMELYTKLIDNVTPCFTDGHL